MCWKSIFRILKWVWFASSVTKFFFDLIIQLNLLLSVWFLVKSCKWWKTTGCVMVDFRKAFYLADHKILLNILKCNKCNEKYLSCFRSYLSSRTKCASLNNTLSKTSKCHLWHSPRLHFRPVTISNLYKRLASSTPKFCYCWLIC